MAERNPRVHGGELPNKVPPDVSKVEGRKPVAPNSPPNKVAGPAPPDLDGVLETWSRQARGLADDVIEAYGPPDEATASHLVWYQNGPWKRTVLWRDGKGHEFPRPHEDRLEQVVDFEFPDGKVDDILRFNGSLTVDRTWGELSCHCDSERTNFLALNLANDVATEIRTTEEARLYMAERILGSTDEEPDEYVAGLRFPVDVGDVGDPDEDAIGATQRDVPEEETRESVGRGRREGRNRAGPGSQRPLTGGRTSV